MATENADTAETIVISDEIASGELHSNSRENEILKTFSGFLDPVQEGNVTGWARDAADADPLVAELFIDGSLAGISACNVFRNDLLGANEGNGFSGFEFKFAIEEISDDSVIKVTVYNAAGLSATAGMRVNDRSLIKFEMDLDLKIVAPVSMPYFDAAKATAIAAFRGHIDLIDVNHIAGWAFRADRPEERLTIEILIDNEVVGEVLASLFREDLVAMQIGDGLYGFTFSFAKGSFVGRPHRILAREKATGFLLPPVETAHPIVHADTRIAGAADSLTQNALSGWAINYCEIDRPVELAIYVGLQLVGRGRTDRYRKDIASQHGGHGFYGFRINLSRPIFKEDFADLRIVAIVYDFPLRVLSSIKERLASKITESNRANKSGIVKGYLDRADRETIAGWAVNEAEPAVPITIDIYVNEFLIRSATAGLPRKDLANMYPESGGRLGFNYQFPYGHSLGGKATISTRIAGNNRQATHSPKTVDIGRSGVYLECSEITRHRDLLRIRHLIPRKGNTSFSPRISAILLNRNGASFLEDLFRSVSRYNTYKNLDFIVIDHGSVDDSLAVCNRWKVKIPIKFINRKRNFSYSASNNFGVSCTDAEVLFFVNNDIQFSSDFLREAVQYLDDEIGIVGFKLASPPSQVRMEGGATRDSLADIGVSIDQIQHLGVRMTTSAGDRAFLPFEEPLSRGNESTSSRPLEVPCVTAAAMLIRRDDFLRVGGFHEEYFYGFEDVDFCLTFRNITGKKIACLNDIKLYHFRSASLQRADESELKAKAKNKDVIMRRLGALIMTEMKKERESNDSFLRDSTIRVAFLVSDVSEKTASADYFTALELARELSRLYLLECVFVPTPEWYALQDFDVAIAMVDGFKPSAITRCRSDIILIVWIRNWFDKWLRFSELKEFDGVWVSSAKALDAFGSRIRQKPALVRIGTNAEYFGGGAENGAYRCDYCFTGSYFGSWREIIGFLNPEAVPYEFALFGHGWAEVSWLAPYYRGPLPYNEMRDVYASTRIVIDDANHTTLTWGSVNSRVYDALAAGALVVTNSRAASEDAFNGLLPVYDSRESLQRVLTTYLEDESARIELVKKLKEIVVRRHTYKHRAKTASDQIFDLIKARRIGLSFDPTDNLEGIVDVIDGEAWKIGTLHLIRGSAPLVKARSFGVDIDIRLTGLLAVTTPNDVLKCRFNVLFAFCQPDRLSQYQARELGERFDLVITSTDGLAQVFESASGVGVYSLNGPRELIGGNESERRFILEGLLRRKASEIFSRIMDSHEEWVLRSKNVPPSVGPSLEIKAKEADSSPAELRVGYVLWDFPALSQTFIINEIRWLVENGHDVCVYYKVSPDRSAALDFEVAAYKVNDSTELGSLLLQHGRSVMHSPFAFPATVHLTYPAAQATGIPFSIMPAGVDISQYDNMRRNRIAEITSSPLCIGVLTIGSYHHQFLLEQGVPEKKILLTRQAVRLKPASAKMVASRWPVRRPKVISIGRFVEKKGFRYLIEAAELLPECEIVLYGYGPLEDELKNLASRLRTGNVTFGGSLDSDDALWEAYASADVFCLPCVRAADGDLDGLPTVILEAMSGGLTVVSSRIANVPDVVVDGITGFLADPKDAPGIAESIKRALDLGEDAHERITGAARRKAMSYASIDDTMSTLTRVWAARALDIILVTYDTGEYKNSSETEEIIDRILRFTGLPFNLIVVDNGSDQVFLDRLNLRYGNFPNFVLIALGKNLFCGPATNLGIEAGSSDYSIYVCSKEGFVLKRGWEQDLVRYMDNNPRVAMAGHLVGLPKWNNGETYLNYPLFNKFRNKDFALQNSMREFLHVQGGIYILRRRAFDECGGFSADVPQNGTDIEYSYFLESKGWELGDVPNLYSATVLTQPSVTAMVDERTVAVHPLSIKNVQYFDRVVSKSGKSCNVCGWQGQTFRTDQSEIGVCPNCSSRNFTRSVYRLLALSDNLQRKPKTLFISSDESMTPVLGRLSAVFQWETEFRLAQIKSRPFDLVIVDHLKWGNGEAEQFGLWSADVIRSGTAFILGEGSNNGPLARLRGEFEHTLVQYDSVVSDFDRKKIAAFNMRVHS